jgi:hypothetical protein
MLDWIPSTNEDLIGDQLEQMANSSDSRTSAVCPTSRVTAAEFVSSSSSIDEFFFACSDEPPAIAVESMRGFFSGGLPLDAKVTLSICYSG